MKEIRNPYKEGSKRWIGWERCVKDIFDRFIKEAFRLTFENIDDSTS